MDSLEAIFRYQCCVPNGICQSGIFDVSIALNLKKKMPMARHDNDCVFLCTVPVSASVSQQFPKSILHGCSCTQSLNHFPCHVYTYNSSSKSIAVNIDWLYHCLFVKGSNVLDNIGCPGVKPKGRHGSDTESNSEKRRCNLHGDECVCECAH